MNQQRILILDHDVTHVTATKRTLELDGYEVHTHTQRFGSANAVAHVRPHLVLLDVDMAGASADRLVGICRATAHIRNTRVVLCSSNDDEALRDVARRLQIDGYVHKGSASALRLEVASVLAR